jgi:hypothetical protein
MELSGKKIAKQKQCDFKRNILKLDTSGKHAGVVYEHILDNNDALNGYNFYCYDNINEWKELQDWANKNTGREDKNKKVNFNKEGLRNMLRSEHIPYNMFFPLAKVHRYNPNLLNHFLKKLIPNIKIENVKKIKIEYTAELNKKKLLNDNTSFDAYIEYFYGNKRGGLGIELKYTEKSYPYGINEKNKLFNKESEYNILAKISNSFSCDFYEFTEHRLKKIKQLLRNHLLGIKLVNIEELDEFYSLHLFPEGNKYQMQACEDYITCLSAEGKEGFIPLTYEEFIAAANDTFNNPKWIKYIENRYLFEN